MYRDVLFDLKQAVQNSPDEQQFELTRSSAGGLIRHPGLPGGELRVRIEDVKILAQKGLITPLSEKTMQEFQLV